MNDQSRILKDIFPVQDAGTGIPGFPFLTEWISPSNIALVKYWGKKEGQIPANPSLSMTLSKAVSRTELKVNPRVPGMRPLSVNGSPDHPFVPKLAKLLQWMVAEIPVVGEFSFEVKTTNTFPHSAGIASSASGISAFSLCMLTFLCRVTHTDLPESEFIRLASTLSRIGSGSACRSVYGGLTIWGETTGIEGSSDLWAVPVNEWIHPLFKDMRDAVLVISDSPKSLSSSKGHSLMTDHPFAEARHKQAASNLPGLLDSLHTGDLEKLASVAENEALTLHALIMTSTGGTILLEPSSIAVIQKVRDARNRGIPLFFTIDAGPNIHLLYPAAAVDQAENFIRAELSPFFKEGLVLFDECGPGPVLVR